VLGYEVDDLNRIGSTRAAMIAPSIGRREEWKPCRKRKILVRNPWTKEDL
jgi:hypothetical protein